MRYLNLIGEVGQIEYESILDWALECCTEFSLTWRSEWENDEISDDLRRKLSPYFLREIDTDEWPGTKIFDGTATVSFYKVTEETINILRPIHLFQFEMPSYPEDLAFYKKKGVWWFGSVAHEEMAFFFDSELSAEEIRSRFPYNSIEIFGE